MSTSVVSTSSTSAASSKSKIAATVAAAVAVLASAGYFVISRRKQAALKALKEQNIYETKRSVNEYLLFHYASDQEILTWPFGPREALQFPTVLGTEAIQFATGHSDVVAPSFERALDIGCAVGRTSFELAAQYKSVIGIDFSHAFIEAAQALASGVDLPYERYEEGDLTTTLLAKAPHHVDTSRVKFEQGDACNLRADLGSFDLVLAANLVCRLPEPMAFLNRLPSLVKPGGLLFLTTPFTWMEQFTPKSKWLGGYYDKEGKPVHSFDTLSQILSAHFTLVHVKDLPFFIREHARKNQWSVTKGSFWVRKADA